MPTETPTPTPATSGALRLLLATLPLAHQQCFSLVSEGFLSFDAVAQRLNDVPGAEQTLMNLGWSDGGYRQFGCDFPPTGSAGWIEVNAHVFDNSSSAQQAVSVFATARAAGTSLTEINLPFVGDEAVALAGPAINGTEYTIYASTGNIMLRVTGVSRDGDPSADVLQVMRSSIVEAGQ